MSSTLKKGTKIAIAVVLSIILALTITITTLCIVYIDNTNLDYERIVINSDNSQGTALKIVHLSDLHFPQIKVDMHEMLKVINENEVDLVAITGDIIDSSADVLSCGVLEFIEKLVKIAPVYYVNGNHETGHMQEQLLYDSMRNYGVVVLEDEIAYFDIGDKQVTIIGITDNLMLSVDILEENSNKDNFKLLLAHRPERERSDSYTISSDSEQLNIYPELVLTGHAHGGQFRLGTQGLVAPNQGIFPEFDSGIYELTDKTSMIVSRGIGNSIIPFRFNNKPHIPIITVYIN